jgi:hypothetical protein
MAISEIQHALVLCLSFSSCEGEKHIYQAMLQKPGLSFALDASIAVQASPHCPFGNERRYQASLPLLHLASNFSSTVSAPPPQDKLEEIETAWNFIQKFHMET